MQKCFSPALGSHLLHIKKAAAVLSYLVLGSLFSISEELITVLSLDTQKLIIKSK